MVLVFAFGSGLLAGGLDTVEFLRVLQQRYRRRREDLYSSVVTTWHREREAGTLQALTPQKRGPKSHRDPVADENQQLRRDNLRLTEELRKADIVIDIQKKVAALLDRPILTADPREKR